VGALTLPTSGTVYLDANCFIYSIERIDPFRAILDTLWQAVSGGRITVVTSELTLLEVLVSRLKKGMRPLPQCNDARPRPAVRFTLSRNARLILLEYAAHPPVQTSSVQAA
jgi:predicted nucleic acid-binding protein